MLLDLAQVWELHDYLIDRNFVLYDENDDETYTRWQHEPSGSVITVSNELAMTEALNLSAIAHAAHIRYPGD
jgi:hypothetical protein